MNTFSLGHPFKSSLRFIAFIFFLAGVGFMIAFYDKSELIALALVLMISGAYVFTVRTYIELKDDTFRITTQTFYFLKSGKWIPKSYYPLTSLKSVQKTYALPRVSRFYWAPDILIQDMDQRVVLTDAYQRRFINLKDFPNGKEATDFINEVNAFMKTEFAMWGTRMRK